MTTSPAGCARPLGGSQFPYLIQDKKRKLFREGIQVYVATRTVLHGGPPQSGPRRSVTLARSPAFGSEESR